MRGERPFFIVVSLTRRLAISAPVNFCIPRTNGTNKTNGTGSVLTSIPLFRPEKTRTLSNHRLYLRPTTCLLPLQVHGQLDQFRHPGLRNPAANDGAANPIFVQQNHVGGVFFQPPGLPQNAFVIE